MLDTKNMVEKKTSLCTIVMYNVVRRWILNYYIINYSCAKCYERKYRVLYEHIIGSSNLLCGVGSDKIIFSFYKKY